MNIGLALFQQQQMQQMQQLQQLVARQQNLQMQELNRLVRELTRADPSAVEKALQSPSAETRWAAARVVALKSLPLQDRLIKMLTDPDYFVRQVARKGLVHLSARARGSKKKLTARKVDFGPVPNASAAGQSAAAQVAGLVETPGCQPDQSDGARSCRCACGQGRKNCAERAAVSRSFSRRIKKEKARAADMTANPEHLLQERGAGDPATLGACSTCIAAISPFLRVQIGQRLQGKVDASDLVQETYLEAHRNFARFRGTSEGQFVCWLRQILAAKLADVLRRYLGTQGRDVRLEREIEALWTVPPCCSIAAWWRRNRRPVSRPTAASRRCCWPTPSANCPMITATSSPCATWKD